MKHYQVQFRTSLSIEWKFVKAITDSSIGNGIRFDSAERLTFNQAEARRRELAREHPTLIFRVTELTY